MDKQTEQVLRDRFKRNFNCTVKVNGIDMPAMTEGAMIEFIAALSTPTGKGIAGYKETLKGALQNSIENQEQENREDFNAGREDAFNYALEMLDKHFEDEATPVEDKGESVEEIPILVGVLNKAQGISGYKKAEIGHPVFETRDRYIINMETFDGKKTITIPYYKESLKSSIEFKT